MRTKIQGPRRAALLPVTLSLMLLAAACTSDLDTSPQQASDPPEASGCSPEIHGALQAWESAGFSGSVAFIGGDRPCIAAYGSADPTANAERPPMTAETTFSIGSITKAVTAAAIGGLVADGRLAYDDRVGDHLPGLSGAAAEPSIKQLLLHTSGLTGSHGRDHEPLTSGDAVAAISTLERAAQPGVEFGYSNAGYATLALVIDAVTGDFRSHLTEQILVDEAGARIGGFWDGEPAAPDPRAVGILESGETGVDGSFDGPHWGLDGSGGVAMTPEELARWTRDFFQGELLAPEAVDALLGLQFDQGEQSTEVPGWVRLDGSVFGEPLFGTSGGGGDIGHDMTVAWLPESDRVFVIASNTPDVRGETLLGQLLPDLIEGTALERPDVGGAIGPDVLAAVTGLWALPDGAQFEVVDGGTGLDVLAINPGAIAAVLPVGDPTEAAAHQRLVLDVLGGSTEEGRAERELLEQELGPIQSVDVFGTFRAEFEYRTYVELGFDGDAVLVWIAVDNRGAIAAAEVDTGPPSVRYLPRPDGSFSPLAPGDGETGLRITLMGMDLEVADEGTAVTASRVP